MYKDHIEYIIGIGITHTIGKNTYITHTFFTPSQLEHEFEPEPFKGCDNDIPTLLLGERLLNVYILAGKCLEQH